MIFTKTGDDPLSDPGRRPKKSDPSDGHAPLYTLAFFPGLWPPVPLHLEAQPEGEASGIGFDLGPEL